MTPEPLTLRWRPGWVPVRVSLCASPLRVFLSFQQSSVSLRQTKNPYWFSHCRASSSWHWRSELGRHVEVGPLAPQVGPLQLRYLSWFSTITHGCKANPFCVFSFLPVWIRLFLLHPKYCLQSSPILNSMATFPFIYKHFPSKCLYWYTLAKIF